MLVALAFLPLTSHAYTNPATAVMGATPAQVLANAPTIVATNLSHMTPAQFASLDDASMVTVWTVAPQAAWSMAGRAGLQAHLSAAVNTATANGSIITTGSGSTAHQHFICRAGAGCSASVTLQMYDVFNALYADVITGEMSDVYLPAASRSKAAWTQVVIIISTSARVGALDILGAVGTGWWLGHDVVGPLALWGLQTYAPSLYDSIGNTVGSLVETFTTNQGLSIQAITEITMFEAQLVSDVGVPMTEYSMPNGDTGVDGSMDASDFGICDPINGC